MWVWLVGAVAVVTALVVLAIVVFRLYRMVMALGRDVASAAERLAESTAALDAASPDGHGEFSARTRRGT